MPANLTDSKIYILILNWNGWRDTIECLESVYKSDYASFQVIVCDNGSQDNSVEYIKQWAEGNLTVDVPGESQFEHILLPPFPKPVRCIVWEEAEAAAANVKDDDIRLIIIKNRANYGFAGGNNVGLRYILSSNEFDYIWLLNNDTVVGKESLKNMVEFMKKNDQIGAIGSKVLYYHKPDIIQTTAGGKFIKYLGYVKQIGWHKKDCGQWDRIYTVDYITGASIFLNRNVIRTVGLMHEDFFMYAEDIDWCIRMRQKGFKLWYCPYSRIWHKEGGTAGYRSPLSEYYATRNILILIRKFYKGSIIPAFLVSFIVKFINRLIRRQGKNLIYILLAYWDFLNGKSGKLEVKE